MPDENSAHELLRPLIQQYARFQQGALSAGEFSDQARRHAALMQALGAAYEEILLHLLDRIESSALFTEESCSFSQGHLSAQLQQWIDKAQKRLALPAGLGSTDPATAVFGEPGSGR